VPLLLPKQEEIVSDLGNIKNIQTFPEVPHDVAQRNEQVNKWVTTKSSTPKQTTKATD